MIGESHFDVNDLLKEEGIRSLGMSLALHKWTMQGLSEVLPDTWDDFEGTEALAQAILRETRH